MNLDQISFSFLTISLFILDKFRLKFRELFSSCCCRCKIIARMKSSAGIIPPSPISTNYHRSTIRNQFKEHTNLSSGGGQIMANVNSNNLTRHTEMNVYTHNGPICFRLTNV
jgi:hypothetical protein